MRLIRNAVGDWGVGDLVEVENGKYGFIVQDDAVTYYLRYGKIWNTSPIYLINYNRAINALVFETYTMLKNSCVS